MDPSPEVDAFVRELTELSRKHGIAIGGCGCCDSPYLYKLLPGQMKRAYRHAEAGQEIAWKDPSEEPEDL